MEIRWFPLLALTLWLLAPAARTQTPDAAPGPAAELQALRADYDTAERAFSEALRQAKSEAEREVLWRDAHPAPDFLPRFQALAERAADTETGAGAHLWVLQHAKDVGERDAALGALASLTTDHMRSPVMEEAAGLLPLLSSWLGRDGTIAVLRGIGARSSHPGAHAAAKYGLGAVLMESRLPEPRAEAHDLFREVKTEAPGTRWASRADLFLFELEHLQVGMKAPDFEATDPNGKTFKLSKYRGKVVVLSFWGFWGSACRLMIPAQKRMVDRLEGKPFALVGINSDGDPAVVRSILQENGITWRNAVDGSPEGPLATRWNVRAWPTIYVLDHKGVIRYRDPRGQSLEPIVRSLIADAELGH
jgi:peroxiredoxin